MRQPIRIISLVTLALILALGAGNAYADAIDDAIRQTESHDSNVYTIGISKLTQQRDPRAIAALKRLLLQASDDKRARAALYVGSDLFRSSFDPQLIDPMITASVKDPNDKVRKAAVDGLLGYMSYGGRRDLSLRRALISALKDPSESVRESAAFALYMQSHKAGAADFMNAALAGLKDPSPAVRLNLVEALTFYRSSPQVATALIPLANDPDQKVRDRARRELDFRGIDVKNLASSGSSIEQQFDDLVAAIARSPLADPGERKTLLTLVPRLPGLPPVPDEAKRLMDFGLSAFKLANSQGDYQAVEDYFQKASALAPWWPNPYYNLGLVLERRGDPHQARSFFELYLFAAPNAADAEAVKSKLNQLAHAEKHGYKVDAILIRSTDALNSKDFKGAAKAAREAIRLSPDNGRAHALLGSALSQADQFKEAIPELQTALRLNFREPFVFAELAFSFKKTGNIRKAIEIYETALKEHPYYAFALQNLGTYYNELGQPRKALGYFEKALLHKDKDVSVDYVERMIRLLRMRLQSGFSDEGIVW